MPQPRPARFESRWFDCQRAAVPPPAGPDKSARMRWKARRRRRTCPAARVHRQEPRYGPSSGGRTIRRWMMRAAAAMPNSAAGRLASTKSAPPTQAHSTRAPSVLTFPQNRSLSSRARRLEGCLHRRADALRIAVIVREREDRRPGTGNRAAERAGIERGILHFVKSRYQRRAQRLDDAIVDAPAKQLKIADGTVPRRARRRCRYLAR